MTSEQKAAFINAQVALCNAELEEMKATNSSRLRDGMAPAYGEFQFEQFQNRWEAILGYNALIKFFNE